jgi:Tol biopolymer transport system component/imidazolonepropionase-like amidohydrolase
MLRFLSRVALLWCTAPLAVSIPSSISVPITSTAVADSVKPGAPDPGPLRTIEFDTDEGTWMNLDLSPDGRTIIFDLLGDIYTLPIEGGDAKLLMTGRAWDHTPRFSPDGKMIAFISDRDGQMNLWVANADGSNPKQLTREYAGFARFPVWTPDGRFVAALTAPGRAFGKLKLFHKDGGSGVELEGALQGAGTVDFTRDGRFAYFSAQQHLHRLDRFNNQLAKITGGRVAGGFKPRISPDGKWLAYVRRHDAETTLRMRDMRTGAERVLLAHLTHDQSEGFQVQDVYPNYVFTPDGTSLIIWIDGKINRVDVATGQSRAIPFKAHVTQQMATPTKITTRIEDTPAKLKLLRWPNLSPDGKKAVFSTIGQIYAMDLPGGTPKRLTNSTDLEYAPAISPDGKWVAYTTWTDTASGHLMVVSVDGGSPRKVTTVAGHYANPSWSRDGSKIAFSRGTGQELRYLQPDDDSYNEVVWVPSSGGEPQVIASVPVSGYNLRYQATTSWNGDGTRVYFVEHVGDGDQLRSARLDGTDIRTHVNAKRGEEMVISPSGTRLLVGRRDDIWVVELPYGGGKIDLNLAAAPVPSKRISPEGGIFPAWLDDSTATWGFAGKIYKFRLGAAQPEVIADVQITAPRPRPTGTIAFRNARIVTMKGDEVIEKGTIVVKENRITAVGPSGSVRIPGDATVVDVSGKTIIPGLVDVHSHMHYSNPETFPKQKWEYLANVAYGVTTGYDPSSNSTDTFAEKEMVETGVMLGPRIFTSGDVVLGDESPGGVDIKGIEDARRIVMKHKAYGTDMLKQYMQPRRDQRQWIAQACRELGVLLTAEGGGDLILDLTMVMDGYNAFEHSLPIAPLYNDVVQFVARSGTHYTPTLIVSYGGPDGDTYFYNTTDPHSDAKLRRFTPEEALDRRRRWTHIPDEEFHWRWVAQSAAKITHAGGLVSNGGHGNRQGLGTHWEMWMFQMGGMTPMEALRASTLIPAQKIGRDQDIGSLEVGKLADFVVLNANPLKDIRNSTKILYTVLNGFVYDGESLTRYWPDRQPIARSFWQSEADLAKWKPREAGWPGKK